MHRVWIVICLSVAAATIAVASLNSTEHEFEEELCNPRATRAAQQTFKMLAKYSQPESILSGQNIGQTGYDLDRSFRQCWTMLETDRGLPTPAVMSLDIGPDEVPFNVTPIANVLEEHIKRGGLVTISMHPRNPWTGGDYNDNFQGSFAELVTYGTPANRRWRAWLADTAYFLQALQRRGIPVLWRPLHEANGDWFWYCAGGDNAKISPTQFKRLWRDMVHSFQQDHGLNNLIWVYCANAQTGRSTLPLDQLYPGDEYVDVVGIDFYGEDIVDLNRFGCYDLARQTGKVIALTEFGAKPMNGKMDGNRWVQTIRNRFPGFSYFVFWHSWPKHLVALPHLDDAGSILNSGHVANRNELLAEAAKQDDE